MLSLQLVTLFCRVVELLGGGGPCWKKEVTRSILRMLCVQNTSLLLSLSPCPLLPIPKEMNTLLWAPVTRMFWPKSMRPGNQGLDLLTPRANLNLSFFKWFC